MFDIRLLLDMDGVLADFVGGVCIAHNRPNPYEDPANFGKFDMEHLWGITHHEFYEPTNNVEFWANLRKTPEANALVELAEDLVGEQNVAILTAPSRADQCLIGKRAWIASHYPRYGDRLIFAPMRSKRFLAGPTNILIDDRDRNVDDFIAAGGHAVPVPRSWNRWHADRHRTLDYVTLMTTVMVSKLRKGQAVSCSI